MFRRIAFLCVANLLAMGLAHAALIDITLSSDKDPLRVSSGESIIFTLGIDPSEVITGYTLDIWYDTTELDFASSEQLVPFVGGGLPPFILDPSDTAGDPGSTGLTTSNSGRASVLQISNSEPVGDLFTLTFTVLDPVADGFDDLKAGIFDLTANDINPSIGGSSFTYVQDVVTAQIAPVPEPTTLWLFGAGVLGMMGLFKRRRGIAEGCGSFKTALSHEKTMS